ncbi:MAG: alpha/beta fold hydrolase [Acetobacteraceae bacterium]|nr:alpha/beta fold hydrolase [Acetobacteraceae bacterium]
MRRLRIADSEIAFETIGCSGPVIVFESGLGGDMHGWEEVARPLATCARVLLYDRLGIGQSGPRHGTDALLANTVADQLRALLQAADLPAPYLLVGHSLGGFYVQAFARRYPTETAAVVLVDSASPLEPPGAFGSTIQPNRGSIAAVEEAGFAPSAAAMLAGRPFPSVPLIVLVATEHDVRPELEALWQRVQAQTAALSPRGRLRIVQGAGHFIQNDRPQIVIEAVLEAMREAGFRDGK